jgi:sugar phosphate isomerase/epimerase
MSHIIALQLYTVRDETARDFKSTPHSVAEIGNAAVKCAGADPIGFMNKYPGRIVALHLKDMTPDRKLTEVGDGTLDIAGYAKAAQAGSTSYFIVENTSPSVPSLGSVLRSFENMRRKLEWW